ncbi:MAG: hypothetical protein IH629_02645 [Thermoleophilia bacterium]|nr:hypothetical protein [Thermoleophilia bacterium]
MKALRTIVATAVIVFAMTTVAMAGVQHLTKENGQAAGSQAQTVQPTYTVTFTAKQLAHLIDDQSGSHAREAQRTENHERRIHRKDAEAQHRSQQRTHTAKTLHVDRVQNSGQSTSGSQSGSHHSEPSNQMHASGSGHDGGGHGGD